MGKFLRQLLEQDNPVGAGVPAGDPDVCFDPITGEQCACPPAGETNPAGDQTMLGGAPQNQDHGPVPEDAESGDAGDKGGDDEAEPDDQGACPEGYEKSDDGKCKKMGGSEGDDKGDKEESVDDKRARLIAELAALEDDDKDDDKPAFLKGGDDDDEEDDEDDDDDKDDKDDDEKDESTLPYRDAVAELVKKVIEGGKARDVVAQAFGSK